MRVIAGTHRGRELIAPKGRATRPTSDRVREALFSILGDVGGLRVLDLFAGSGALAIEALSRGAGQATMVDSASAAIAAIRRNLDSLGLEGEAVRQPAGRFLQAASRVHPGGTILLADGRYLMPQHVELKTDNVTLRSASGHRERALTCALRR